MRNINKPDEEVRPKLLADEEYGWWAMRLAPAALKRLQEGWHGVFRRSILKLMPVEELGKGFRADFGRPTKELYAMAGLMLIAEFRDLTGEQVVDAYCYDASVQFALNVGRDGQYLAARTVDNYRRRFREDDLAADIFAQVSETLVKELELSVAKQRLDSTHVLSNMAQFSRQQLLATGTRRFLVQLKKRHCAAYESLPEALRSRYSTSESRLFGQGTKKPLGREEVLEQLGQDMALLIGNYRQKNAEIAALPAFKNLSRLFEEHFEVLEVAGEKIKLRPRSTDEGGGSGGTLQNTSDPDAGYNGHKGAGYQAQIAQTLPPQDAKGRQQGPGLITALIPQSAGVRDNEALPEVIKQQTQNGLGAQQMTADTIYGSDANVMACAQQGLELVSPVGGAPQGPNPSGSNPGKKVRELRERLHARRAEEQTDEWKQTYRKRSGIEGLNRALDAVTGFKQLRVRGVKAVSHALYLKATGWNIKAAAQIMGLRRRKAPVGALRPSPRLWLWLQPACHRMIPFAKTVGGHLQFLHVMSNSRLVAA